MRALHQKKSGLRGKSQKEEMEEMRMWRELKEISEREGSTGGEGGDDVVEGVRRALEEQSTREEKCWPEVLRFAEKMAIK